MLRGKSLTFHDRLGIIGACTIQVFHSLAGRLKQDARESQYRLNRIAWREYRKKIPGGYLENQPALTGFLYGVASKTQPAKQKRILRVILVFFDSFVSKVYTTS